MRVIACNQAYRLTSNGNLQKWLVAWVRQRVGKWRRSHNVTMVLDMVQEGNNLVYVEPEPGTTQDFVVFGQNASVEIQRQLTGGNHAHNFGARSERRQEASHKDIGIEDYFHPTRFLRTALISASISSIEILSVPCSIDRR